MASDCPDATVDRNPTSDILETRKKEHAELRNLVAPIFEGSKIGPFSVYLYGSRTSVFARSDSDYDFALIASFPIEHEELEVDCVDMRSIPLTLAAQVIESSVLLLRGHAFQRNMLERVCQAAIDLGMRWVRIEALGIPKESRDAFTSLATNQRLSAGLAESLKHMVGFRDIAVHDYREIDFNIVRAIIDRDFPDFHELIRLGLRLEVRP